MSFSYTQPTINGWQNPVHEVRNLIDDTVEGPQSVTDEEVALVMARYVGDEHQKTRAAIDLAQTLHLRFSKNAATSKSVGDLSLSVDYGRTSAAYLALIDRLTGTLPGTGGLAGAGAAMMHAVPSQFGIGQFDASGGALGRYGR